MDEAIWLAALHPHPHGGRRARRGDRWERVWFAWLPRPRFLSCFLLACCLLVLEMEVSEAAYDDATGRLGGVHWRLREWLRPGSVFHTSYFLRTDTQKSGSTRTHATFQACSHAGVGEADAGCNPRCRRGRPGGGSGVGRRHLRGRSEQRRGRPGGGGGVGGEDREAGTRSSS
jgi:hypothetical protein